jgi:hypothetical protein
MALNPENDRDIKRLRAAMDHSRKALLPFREQRVYAIKQYVGTHYGDAGAAKKVPMNLLELAINTYTRQLSANNPRFVCTTKQVGLKPKASKFEIALNNLIQEIEFYKTMRVLVINAMFSMGIAKVGMSAYKKVELDGFTHDVGQTFADSVDLDDWVHDCNARRFDQIQFAGNKYRLPLAYVKESGLYDNADDLKATTKHDYEKSEDKAEDLSKKSGAYGSDEDEYQDHIELWDLWLPQENLIVTMPCGDGKPIRVVEWEGPEYGPYHLLSFGEVPNNIMPLAPVELWIDLHDLANGLMRKLSYQAERQKTVLGIQRGQDADGKRIVKANDGDAIAMDDPSSAKEYRYGGMDQQNLGFMLQINDVYSRHAGNLDTLGGLSPQADTATQERILSESASKRMTDLQDRTVQFTKEVGKALGWHLWYDKLTTLPLYKRDPGTGYEIPMTFTPEERDGDLYEYNIDIEPYSMQDKGPGAKLRVVKEFIAEVVAPFAPQMAQAGMQINFEGLARTYAKYANMNELEEIITFGNPQAPPPEAAPEQTAPAKPSTTTRNYVRTSRPGASRGGKEAIMAAALFGGNPQPAEQQAATRAIG